MIVPSITLHIVLHKWQKALMKTSGGFRSEADTQKMSFFSLFPSYPSTGPHNSVEPSCGNVIVWWRWSKQCDRVLKRLPDRGLQHTCHARVRLTLQVLIYATALASKIGQRVSLVSGRLEPLPAPTFLFSFGFMERLCISQCCGGGGHMFICFRI